MKDFFKKEGLGGNGPDVAMKEVINPQLVWESRSRDGALGASEDAAWRGREQPNWPRHPAPVGDLSFLCGRRKSFQNIGL